MDTDIKKEIAVVRELGKRVFEIANTEKHVRMRKRFRDTNDLIPCRPPLIIEEIPWAQMNIDRALDCVCEDKELRKIENSLRVLLFREKYLCADNYITPYFAVKKSFSSSGNGFAAKEKTISGKNTTIRSHEYEDILENESALEAFHLPVITPHPEKDEENLARAHEIFDGVMPVELRGANRIYYAPWDIIARLRGVEPILIDIYDRPEYLHKIIRLFSQGMSAEMDQMEKYGLYDPRGMDVHCTPGEFSPSKSSDGNYGCRDIWFRTMAQMFSSISPAAHKEFDMDYSAPLAARCALTYYGCCEPLHDRIGILKSVYPNLRKIGVSPWAKVEESAEQIRGDYVLSRKPNPANVAIATDPEIIRREIRETVEICLKYGCPYDITLKDISTVSDRPENLILWAKTASAVLDEYYGEA